MCSSDDPAMMPSALGTSQSLSVLEGLLSILSLNNAPLIYPDPNPNEDEKSEPNLNRFAIREAMITNLDSLTKWMFGQIHQFRVDTMKSIDRIISSDDVQDDELLTHRRTFERKMNETKTNFKESLNAISTDSCDLIEVDGPNPLSMQCTDSNRRYEGIWSNTFGGNGMTLSADQRMVTLKKRFQSIRFENAIPKGLMVQIQLKICCTRLTGNFIGVTSSKSTVEHFHKRAMDENGMMDCYGIDTCSNRVYMGNDRRFTETEWHVPKAEVEFDDNSQSIVTMVVDLTSDDHHGVVLFSFASADSDENAGYMVTLPHSKAHMNHEWFPAVSLSRPDSWCEIMQTQVVQ